MACVAKLAKAVGTIDYFGSKMYQGMAYMVYGKKYETACNRFAEKVLPALQSALKEELKNEVK